MTQINAYLGFNGKCREAMNFYKECLGGELNFITVEGSPMEAQCPAAMKHQILHSTLAKNGFVLMGTDVVGPNGYTKGNNIALSVNCASEEEIHSFFSNLSAGGTVIDPLKVQFWGALFGVLTDKYGITWMLSYDTNPRN
jgi:PhnB protein